MGSIGAEELGALEILGGLGERDLAALAGVMARRELADGEVLFEQGADSDGVYLVLSGQIRVVRRLPGGSTVDLSWLGPGSLVGTLAALDGGTRGAECRAAGPVACAWLRQPEVSDLMDGASPAALRFQVAVLRALFGNIRGTNYRIAELATLPSIPLASLGAPLAANP